MAFCRTLHRQVQEAQADMRLSYSKSGAAILWRTHLSFLVCFNSCGIWSGWKAANMFYYCSVLQREQHRRKTELGARITVLASSKDTNLFLKDNSNLSRYSHKGFMFSCSSSPHLSGKDQRDFYRTKLKTCSLSWFFWEWKRRASQTRQKEEIKSEGGTWEQSTVQAQGMATLKMLCCCSCASVALQCRFSHQCREAPFKRQ